MNLPARTMQKGPSKKGFSLVEIVVYIGILALLTVVIVNTLLILSRSWNAVKVDENIAYASADSLERMTTEIRNAQSVVTDASVFGNPDGTLVLNSIDPAGDTFTTKFFLINSVLNVQVAGGTPEPLFPSGVTATDLTFNYINDSQTEAIEITMQLQSTYNNKSDSKDFYTTVVLRDEYKN